MWSIKTSENSSSSVHERVVKAYHQFKARKDLGFFNLDRFVESVSEVEKHSQFMSDKDHLVVVGLGGSSLGTKALCEALWPGQWAKKMTFLDNVDAFSVDQFLSSTMDFEKVGWVLCSKSGSTIEVTTLYDYCSGYLASEKNLDITKKTIVVTEDKPSALFNFAKANDIATVIMPKDIGGRFSVFTAIGLLPLSYLGFDFDKAKQGFAKAIEDEKNLVALSSHLINSIEQDTAAFYSFQYVDRLLYWSLWLQQLWSESLSKASDRSGGQAAILPTLIAARGASDQHSVLQQLIEGHEKKTAVFHRVLESEQGQKKIEKSHFENTLMTGQNLGHLLKVEAEATEMAVREAGTPTLTIETESLNEASMAYLMGLWMMTIGVLGELMDINAFDQPGVESGKVIARRVLSQAD